MNYNIDAISKSDVNILDENEITEDPFVAIIVVKELFYYNIK
jgi:hypothetical protein